MSQQKGKGTANSAGLPDIGSIHYGTPTFENKSPKKPQGIKGHPSTVATASQSTKGAASKNSSPSKETTTAIKKKNSSPDSASQERIKKKASPNTEPRPKSQKELEEERRIAEKKKRAEELQRQRLLEIQKKERERRAQFFKLLFKEIAIFLKNAAFGIIIALIAGLIIGLIYYRSITSYNSEAANHYYAFYAYIDPEDETENAELRRKARENGTESAKVSFKKKHIVINDISYLPLSSLTDFFGLSMSGNDTVRTVNITGSGKDGDLGDSAVFTAKSNNVIINGSVHTMSNAPLFRNGDVYVPFEFFEKYIVGISFKSTTEWGKTTIGVILEQPRISFIGSSDNYLVTPNIRDYITNADATYSYSFDITPYEQYINPTDPNKYLTLINVENRLSSDYEPNDLIDVLHTRATRAVPERMRLDAAKSLEAMLKAAEMDGITDVSVTSGYRDYTYQNQLFTTRLNEKLASGAFTSRTAAEEETAKFTMYPGASEHQSGLCADMHNLPSAMQSFAQTEAYSWLYKHCADFGFILRYPQNKEEITGISFEPWHYRFVGRFHAQLIMESGLCLEEYMELYNSSEQ